MTIIRSALFFVVLACLAHVETAASPGAVPDPRTQVYAPGEVDREPKLMFFTKTTYPPALKTAGIAGEVIIECVVDLDGVVRDPVVKSSTRKEFELPALQSVAKWKFRPGRKNKEDVNVRVKIPVKFELKK